MMGEHEWINGVLLAVPSFIKIILAFPVAYLADTGSKERIIKAGTQGAHTQSPPPSVH